MYKDCEILELLAATKRAMKELTTGLGEASQASLLDDSVS